MKIDQKSYNLHKNTQHRVEYASLKNNSSKLGELEAKKKSIEFRSWIYQKKNVLYTRYKKMIGANLINFTFPRGFFA